MALFAFFLGGVAGAGEFEKFVGEIAIGVGHGGERGSEGQNGMERSVGVRMDVTVGALSDSQTTTYLLSFVAHTQMTTN